MTQLLHAETNLSPMKEKAEREITVGFNKFLKTLVMMGCIVPDASPNPSIRFFSKAGAPVENTAKDSPGADLCFIYDTVGKNLWLVYNFVSATDFSVVEIITTP